MGIGLTVRFHHSGLLFLALITISGFWPHPVHAEIMQRIQAGIEEVAKGMDYVGEQAGQLIGTGIPLQGEAAAAVEHRRLFEEQYPVGEAPKVALSNEFGAIHVSTWNENIIKITAEIIAGGESKETAEHLADVIEIKVSPGMDVFECRTVYPEVKSTGQLFLSVNYTVQIPQNASLTADNFFGDVLLSDIGGAITVDVQYGGLKIINALETVHARVQGDFPVHINGLARGGVFKFQGVSAELENISGEVDINHFRGKITLQRISADATITLNCDSAQSTILLTPEINPDLSAIIVYGKLDSSLDVSRSLKGTQLVARHPAVGATQKIFINATFSEVVIAMEGKTPETDSASNATSKIFTDIHQETIRITENTTVYLSTLAGNIQVEGADTDHILLEATRVAWTPSASAALDALDALELSTRIEDNNIYIQTSVTQDMTIFDCESYRVDLRLVYPRELPLHINAQEGITTVDGIGNGLFITQGKGEINLQHIKNAVTATNTSGNIKIQDCSGPIEASTQYGAIAIERVYGNIRTNAVEGSTYLDGVHGDVVIRHKSGDVKLLCLDPMQGNLDILVEDGNLNAFIAPDSDAALNVKAVNGRIQSSLSLSGTINRDFQEFFGRLNGETHTVRFECINGDVFLN
jgi:DUF4097 and DUF4098 domain-containing protein YvlB